MAKLGKKKKKMKDHSLRTTKEYCMQLNHEPKLPLFKQHDLTTSENVSQYDSLTIG